MLLRLAVVFLFLRLASAVSVSDVCPEIPDGIPCTEVSNWYALVYYIDHHTSEDPLDLCPFDIVKPHRDPVVISKRISIRCQQQGACVVRGEGSHIIIEPAEEDPVILQGLTFQESDEHAVHIKSIAARAVTILCGCRFIRNQQSDAHDGRGGAVKTEQDSGHVSLIGCTFEENASNYAGAIYNRANFLEVRHCVFLDNTSTGPAGAIFNAKYATIYIEGCQFRRNLGGDNYAIVMKGGADGQWHDGGSNDSVSNGVCNGFYVLATDTCTEFVIASSSPSAIPLTAPLTVSLAPTETPSVVPTVLPSVAPSMDPSTVPLASQISTVLPLGTPSTTPSKTKTPSKSPTASPSQHPSGSPSQSPTGPTLYPSDEPSISTLPSVQPTIVPSSSPTADPTGNPSVSFTMNPSREPSVSPTQSVAPSESLPPTMAPTLSHAPSSITENLCGDREINESEPCVSINSWEDILGAIENSEDRVVLCPFAIQKQTRTSLVINRDIELVCKSVSPVNGICSIKASGTVFTIRGDSRVTLKGLTFTDSDSSALRIGTDGVGAVTMICYCEFHNNSRAGERNGGALFAGDGAGEIYVAFSTFWSNDAGRGGAIWSESNKLTVLDSTFVLNYAKVTGSSIYVGESTHLLLRSNQFQHNVGQQQDVSIVVKPVLVSPLNDTQGVYVDAGGNIATGEGICNGFFVLAENECQTFHSQEADPAIIYPFVRGDLTDYYEDKGFALATGLRARELAKVNESVKFGSDETDLEESELTFHRDPDGAAVVAAPDGGWIYLSNSESTTGDRTGGVFAIIFDSEGEIKGYEPRLEETTRNCNGGLTPWQTWVSCEEYAKGQCWQVDPFGEIEPEIIVMGGSGGNFEAFAYDDRNAVVPSFFVTEDHDRGALRRFRPTVETSTPTSAPSKEPSLYSSFESSASPSSVPTQPSDSIPFRRLNGMSKAETWDLLHGDGTLDYLKFIPGTNRFEWTSSLEEGRETAESYFPGTEGISCRDGLLYFVSKKLFRLFILDLDNMTYTSEDTRQGLMIGRDGDFRSHGDHLVHLSSEILYFTEDGGPSPGIYGRVASTGHYFVLFEAIARRFKHDEATGLAFSPDWRRMYFCIQEHGLMFEVTREDGQPFEHDEIQLLLKSHPGKNHG